MFTGRSSFLGSGDGRVSALSSAADAESEDDDDDDEEDDDDELNTRLRVPRFPDDFTWFAAMSSGSSGCGSSCASFTKPIGCGVRPAGSRVWS